ncbi:MAG: TadE/TadG family type IV pilus assembly protein [Pseudomonadota bacterium]
MVWRLSEISSVPRDAKRTIIRFYKQSQANVAIITALSLMPILMLIGGSVDFTRAALHRAELQAAIDSAVLAASNLTSSENFDEVIEDYLDANLTSATGLPGDYRLNITTQSSLNSRTVAIEVEMDLPTYFLGLVDLETLPISAESIATESKLNIELALVVDISSSMVGAKLTSLQDSAKVFVDHMISGDSADYTSLSLIPFGGTVNIGEDLFNASAVTPTPANTDPDEDDYDIGSNVLYTPFRFTDGDFCLEHRNDDFDADRIPSNSRSQVPHFWRWWNFHPWCPGEKSAVLLNSNDADALKGRIDSLVLSDGTGMDIGAMWGLKALSPAFRGAVGGDFSDRPANFGSDDTLKFMVVMTDGAITSQNRPEDYSLFNVHTNRNNNSVPNVGSRSNQGNRRNMQTVVGRGNSGSASGAGNAIGHFKKVCDIAHDNGVVVYTIGFQINPNSLPEQMLEYCASDPTKYFLVDDFDIQSAFDAIAASVNSLRVVQ